LYCSYKNFRNQNRNAEPALKFKMYKTSQKQKIVITSIAAMIVQFMAPVFADVAMAAPIPGFQQVMVRFDRMQALTPTGGMVCATPATAGVETSVKVKMPTQASGTDYTVNATAANWTVDTLNLPQVPVPSGGVYTLTTPTAWPGIGTATAVSGKTVTFPSTDLTVGTTYCFHFSGTNTLTNGDAGYVHVSGQVDTYDVVPTVINESQYATSVITNDQIAVSAIVPPSFRFSLDGNADAFATDLQTDSIVYTGGRSFSVITNAKGGWIAWVKDSQQGLYSSSAAYKIPTTPSPGGGAPGALTPTGSSEGYGMTAQVTTQGTPGCTMAIDALYTPAGPATPTPFNTTVAGDFSANFQPVVSCTGAAPATSNGDTVRMVEAATIAGGTPAGSDYGDIITVVGAGNF
jgi:hypothetical protein